MVVSANFTGSQALETSSGRGVISRPSDGSWFASRSIKKRTNFRTPGEFEKHPSTITNGVTPAFPSVVQSVTPPTEKVTGSPTVYSKPASANVTPEISSET